METYNDLFGDWKQVALEFTDLGWNLSDEDKEKAALAIIPEPEEVLFAGYKYESYSGDALVVYKNDGKIYEVHGSHCSCYGLEGQWEPEEYTRDLYLEVLDRRISEAKSRGWR